MDNIIFGIRPVAEAIEAGKEIERIYIRKGGDSQLLNDLRDLCLRHRLRVHCLLYTSPSPRDRG